MAGQWEVVSNKRNRGDGNKKNSNQKKKNAESMPKVEESVPIKESQTMFTAFLEKEKKRAQLEMKASAASQTTSKPKEGGASQPKKKNQEKKKNQPAAKPPSLEEAIKLLNVEEMKTQYATDVARFPDTPLLWLQDLASYTNIKLDVEITDPFFAAHPFGYPACLVSKEIKTLLLDAINSCSAQTQQMFFESCLQSMLQDSIKGLNTVGYRIILQLFSQEKPDHALMIIPKCIDFRNTYQNRQNVCLSVFWAIGQAGNKNLEVGLKVWTEVMFPFLGTKTYSKFVIEYLEKLLSHHKDSKISKSLLGVRDLFPILDAVHSSSGLPSNLQKQFQALYPKLRALSYGSEPKDILRNYFPSYLRRLEPNSSPSLKEEVFRGLLQCLTVDKMSYSVWRQLYIKHLVQSSLLIANLRDVLDDLPPSFPRKLLCETLSAFQVTNDELVAQGKKNQTIEDCISSSNAVLKKMSAHPFPWLKVLLLATVLVSSLLAYDVQQSGSFKSSKTGQLMKDAGLLAICEQAWGKITIYTAKVFKWLDVNVPIFGTWLRDTCGPCIESFWNNVLQFCSYLWQSSQGARTWVNKNIPPILQKVSDVMPTYTNTLSQYAKTIIGQVWSQASSLFRIAEHYSHEIVAWIHKNVLTGSLSPENLQKYAGETVQAFQEYTLTTYNWIINYVATVYPGK